MPLADTSCASFKLLTIRTVLVRDVLDSSEALYGLRQPQGRDGQERHVLQFLWGEAIGEPSARVGMHRALRERAKGKGKLHKAHGAAIQRTSLGAGLAQGSIGDPYLGVASGNLTGTLGSRLTTAARR
jgi:hypothetical protein